MGETHVFELPYPPSLNRAYRTYRGRVILSKVARDYVKLVADEVGSRKLMLSSRLSVVFHIYPPDKRKRDIANTEKLICDSMTKAGVWNDDSLIDSLHLIRCSPENNGRVVVSISEVK